MCYKTLTKTNSPFEVASFASNLRAKNFYRNSFNGIVFITINIISLTNNIYCYLVPRRGLEPPHPKAHGPEPCASTNSAIWAFSASYPRRQNVANSIGNHCFVNEEEA